MRQSAITFTLALAATVHENNAAAKTARNPNCKEINDRIFMIKSSDRSWDERGFSNRPT